LSQALQLSIHPLIQQRLIDEDDEKQLDEGNLLKAW
jgi:hypothetical protein